MKSPLTQRIAQTKAELARLEQELAVELASLPSQYGFSSVDAFLDAVGAATKGSGVKRGAKTRKKRTVVTQETRDEVKRLVGEGKTGAFIATALDISGGTVNTIKKQLGLVGKAKVGRRSAKK